MAPFAYALGDLQIGLAGILEQFAEFRTHGRVVFEQQFFEHDAMDADHFLHMGSKKIHEKARFDCLVQWRR